MPRQSDQSKHFCGAAGSDQGQSITVKFWTQSNMENLTDEMGCEALKQLVREMRYAYCQNVIHATQNGDIVATEAYQRQVKKLDDIFAKIHKGVQPSETIELPPMPKSYGPTPRPAPHYPHYPLGFPQQRMPFFSSYSSVLPSAADYQQPFAMQPEGYVPPPSYTDAMSLGGFTSLLTATESSQNTTFSSSEQQREQQSPTSRGIAETVRARETCTPTPVAIGVQREPKVNSSARKSIANDYEDKAVKTEQDTIVRQTNPVKTERELTTSDGKEMDRTKTGKLQSATKETAKPPQSLSKITPEKQKRDEGVKFSSGKNEVKQEADRYLPQICVDPKPSECSLVDNNEMIMKLSRFVPQIEELFRLLSNVDDVMKREKLDWSQRTVEDNLLGHSEFSHISELILWEILLIREEDYGLYLNPVIREYLNKIKVLKYMDGKVHVEINQLADQIADLWQNSNNLTKLAELWKILMSDELRNVFIVEAIPNNNGKIETWVRLNRCLNMSNLFTVQTARDRS